MVTIQYYTSQCLFYGFIIGEIGHVWGGMAIDFFITEYIKLHLTDKAKQKQIWKQFPVYVIQVMVKSI